MIEIYFAAPDRETWAAAVVTHGFAKLDEHGTLEPVAGAQFAEVPELCDPETGEPIPGKFHCNVRVYGALEAMLTAGLPQIEPDGRRVGLFDATHILDIVPGLEWVAVSDDPVPPGYEGATGVRIFDPAFVATPRLVWA